MTNNSFAAVPPKFSSFSKSKRFHFIISDLITSRYICSQNTTSRYVITHHHAFSKPTPLAKRYSNSWMPAWLTVYFSLLWSSDSTLAAPTTSPVAHIAMLLGRTSHDDARLHRPSSPVEIKVQTWANNEIRQFDQGPKVRFLRSPKYNHDGLQVTKLSSLIWGYYNIGRHFLLFYPGCKNFTPRKTTNNQRLRHEKKKKKVYSPEYHHHHHRSNKHPTDFGWNRR